MPTQDHDVVSQMDRIWSITERLGGFEDLSDADLRDLQLAIERELRLRESKTLAADNLEAARGEMMMAPWSDAGAVRVSQLVSEDRLREKP